MSLAHHDNRFDFLRLLAAWLVLFSHCFPLGDRPQHEPWMAATGFDTLGGIGVSIFFVLSGYLVTLSLQRSPNLLEFTRRRALRIYPGLIAICLLSVLVLGPLMTAQTPTAYWHAKQTWNYLLTASGWQVQYVLLGVFADNPQPYAINGSLWSLPYEITCYAALALLSVLPGNMRAKVTLVAIALGGLLLLRPPLAVLGLFNSHWGLDYYHCKLGLLFALGAAFASWGSRLRALLWPAAVVVVVALLMPHNNWQLLLYLLGLGTVILWLALYGLWLPRVPARMGDWSYGAYLYGFPVQQVLAHFKLHETSFVAFVVASTALTFAFAGLSWHCVEKQAMRWK